MSHLRCWQTYDVVRAISYVISYVRYRTCDVEPDIVRMPYDVVGCTYDIVRRRTMSYLARIQMKQRVTVTPSPALRGSAGAVTGSQPLGSGLSPCWSRTLPVAYHPPGRGRHGPPPPPAGLSAAALGTAVGASPSAELEPSRPSLLAAARAGTLSDWQWGPSRRRAGPNYN